MKLAISTHPASAERPTLATLRAAPASDLTQQVRILGEVVAGLLERTDLLEEQRSLLEGKLGVLEALATTH